MAIVNATNGSGVNSWGDAKRHYRYTNYINLGTANVTLPTTGANSGSSVIAPAQSTGIATGDVIQAFSVPAKTFVQNVIVETVVAANKVATATVGDTASANSWDGSTDLAAAAGTQTYAIGGTDAYATQGGKLYSTGDNIILTCTVTAGPITSGVIKVMADCIEYI